MAKLEVSVSCWKGLVGLGLTNIGAERKVALRASKELSVVEVQRNGVSFLVSMIRGCDREETLR